MPSSSIATSAALAAHDCFRASDGTSPHARKAPCGPHAKACCARCYADAQADAERSSVRVLPSLLSASDVAECLEAGEVWPHMCELGDCHGGPCAGLLCAQLEGAAHDVAFSEQHIMLYLHRERFLQQNWPALWRTILRSMSSPPLEWGVEPEAELHVRCIELHSYAPGGGLLAPAHRDNGSIVTLTVLLSEPGAVHGGEFTTLLGGSPVMHRVEKGGAILFRSEKVHHVQTVTRGIRKSLVVELWSAPENTTDRFR